uniref:Putative NADH dehydrogenase n=1 Tax=viral metagenome TaxID=1070528 RepID=A0A6M3MFC9_9ZZZZ
MRILVTGSAGFIASRLVERLLQEGHEVVGYDLRPSPVGEYVVGDITDGEAFGNALEGYEHVFHLAAAADLNWCSAHPNEAVKANIEGTRVVAEECAKRDVTLSFASTCCVYGNTPTHPSDEMSICSPTDIYGATKVVAEELIKGYHRKMGLTYHLLRFGTTYGPGMRPTLAIYVFLQQALEDKTLTIHGSGEQTRCMIYIDDLVESCVKTLDLDHHILGTTLNIATEEELSVTQMAQTILKLTGKPLDQYIHVSDRVGQIMKEQIDTSKARKMLSWEPHFNFEEGISKTIEWFIETERARK